MLKKILRQNLLIICIVLSSLNVQANKILHHTENEFGPLWVIEPGEHQNLRCIIFTPPPATAVQSCMIIDNPARLFFNYQKMMLSSLWLKSEPKKILIIGLGGGDMARALRILVPQADIDIVEINPVIIEVAKKYFKFDSNISHINLIKEDGARFVDLAPDGQYDIVLVDAFTKDYIPEYFLTETFTNNIKRVLTNDGIAVFNGFKEAKYEKQEQGLYSKVFGARYILTDNLNNITISSKNSLLELENISKSARESVKSFNNQGIFMDELLPLFKKAN